MKSVSWCGLTPPDSYRDCYTHFWVSKMLVKFSRSLALKFFSWIFRVKSGRTWGYFGKLIKIIWTEFANLRQADNVCIQRLSKNNTMKKWNFKVKSNPNAISRNLESSLGSINGLVFKTNSDNSNFISFKIRKRLLYAWYIFYHNNVIVNGRLSKSGSKNETNIDIYFRQ